MWHRPSDTDPGDDLQSSVQAMIAAIGLGAAASPTSSRRRGIAYASQGHAKRRRFAGK